VGSYTSLERDHEEVLVSRSRREASFRLETSAATVDAVKDAEEDPADPRVVPAVRTTRLLGQRDK